MFRAEPHSRMSRPRCANGATASPLGDRRRKEQPMRVRNAILPDAEAVERLIAVHTGDGTLLPRTLAEICENIRDFVVVEHHGHIIGCGALHLYGVHLAEIRSITVKPEYAG